MAIQDPVKWFRRQNAPVTVVLCGLLIMGAIVCTFSPFSSIENLMFDGQILPRFWTLFTYPFIGGISIFLIFEVLWMFWVGSMIESDLSSKRFAIIWLLASVVGVLPLALFKAPVVGMAIPGAVLMTIWATRNPNMTVRVFMCIPVAAKWIAIVTVICVFAMYGGGGGHLQVGFAAIAGCIVAFFYARNQLPGVVYGKGSMNQRNKPQSRAAKVYKQEYYDEVHRREKEREEKERLRKLFEGSLEDK